ncbi:CBS domain-containing protein [Selenihalanaerobacter shriftii]|uniref:Histidine kinase-like ATPase domain-containing protein n=1 Tax=Selenihalanaerobacter shriftii TaxID=142842 RepID=A0A1T4MK25_9FIRM|nr:CBS domain-containing protein [Selenihalanaerobacter shriftii]SJZ67440.1 Histidine kinase-like ATPase domain-containing protein [Selenihalanaerobacter shriftii]
MKNSSVNLEFVEKLANDLTVKDIMTNDVITLRPDNKLKNAKEIMRLRKISGIPIINSDRHLKGIISIDDIIRGLEENRLEDNLSNLMSTELITIKHDISVIEALRKFKKHKYGRLPVIDENDVLMGIITPGDITRKLLEEVEKASKEENFFFVNDSIDEEERDNLQIEIEIEGGDFSNSGEASSRIKEVLQQVGVPSTAIRKAAIVTYEAEMNVVIHARRGIILAKITPEEIKIIVEDEGPGIENVDLAMEPGYSTASEHVRELGFGAGMGLTNIERWADDLEIESKVDKGTRLEITIYL